MKEVQEYLALPYTKVVKWSADDGLFVAHVKEIEGCNAHGDSEASALEMLRDNLQDWIEFALEEGDHIPIPDVQEHLPSGKWLQRVTRHLHKQLIECAEHEGVSLNTFVSTSLALAVGKKLESERIKEHVVPTLYGGGETHGVHYYAYPAQKLAGALLYGQEPGTSVKSVYLRDVSSDPKPIALGRECSPYTVVVNSLVERLPNHTTNPIKRIHRESKEESKELAYAC